MSDETRGAAHEDEHDHEHGRGTRRDGGEDAVPEGHADGVAADGTMPTPPWTEDDGATTHTVIRPTEDGFADEVRQDPDDVADSTNASRDS